jgi:DNA-binding NarL/FixJ family response regulator
MAQARILYVEDYPVVQIMYVEVLNKTFTVDVASDGKDALNKATTAEYDVILLDLLLPQMSGLEFLRAYQKVAPNSTSRVVVLSDFDNPETRDDVAKLGVEHFWVKVETTPHVLVDRLQNLLKPSDNQ